MQDLNYSNPADENPQPPLAQPINGHAKVDTNNDPFAAGNFSMPGSDGPKSFDDVNVEVRVPNDEEFVRVSTEARHSITATLLVVSREDGYGKSYFLLTPQMSLWAKNQPSLRKFVKPMHLFLFVTQDGEYGIWPIRDSLDNWATSDLQVVETAKKFFTRRFTQGKVRKAHTSTSIDTEVRFPNKAMTGSDGILRQAFGEAFVITSVDHLAIKKLMR